MSYNDSIVSRYVTSQKAANNIKYAISNGLGVQASAIHPPYEVIKSTADILYYISPALLLFIFLSLQLYLLKYILQEILEKMALQDALSSGGGLDSDVTQAGVLKWNVGWLPAVLIAIGSLVFAMAIIAMLYLCFIRR